MFCVRAAVFIGLHKGYTGRRNFSGIKLADICLIQIWIVECQFEIHRMRLAALVAVDIDFVDRHLIIFFKRLF